MPDDQMAPNANHHLFFLHDPQAPEDPHDMALPDVDEILRASRFGIVFSSGGDLFQPAVTLEVWGTAADHRHPQLRLG